MSVPEPATSSARPGRPKPLPTLVSELWELTVTYLKQETVEPIKGLGRYIALGVAGSIFVSIGLVLLVLAGLRALQTETGETFEGNWTWAPYFITLVGCAFIIGLSVRAISKGKGPKKGKP
ncbi:MAG: hypothetical protein ACLGHT_08595 [Acidimicrobiia bacterium]